MKYTLLKSLIFTICTALSFVGLYPIFLFPYDMYDIVISNNVNSYTEADLSTLILLFVTFLVIWLCYATVGIRWMVSLLKAAIFPPLQLSALRINQSGLEKILAISYLKGLLEYFINTNIFLLK